MISGSGVRPSAATRAAPARIARVCIFTMSGTISPRRTPRRPSIGFCSTIASTAWSSSSFSASSASRLDRSGLSPLVVADALPSRRISFIARAASFLPKTRVRPFSRVGVTRSATASVSPPPETSRIVRSRVTSAISSSWLGQELVERRVDEADDDREAVHGAEEAGEVIGLEALELAEGGIERLDRLAILRRCARRRASPSRRWRHER